MKLTLDFLGFGDCWYQEQLNVNVNMYPIFLELVKDQFIQNWKAEINDCRKLKYYCKFKVDFIFEPYLFNIKSDRLRISLTRFRLSAHSVAIETGRFINVDRENRLCLVCNQKCVESKFHFLLVCNKYRDLRYLFLNKYSSFPSTCNFFLIMSSNSIKLQLSLAKHVNKAMRRRLDIL